MVPYARSRLRQLEQRRQLSGAPFLHSRVFADGTTTVDITASAHAPRIRIRSADGAYAVAQYDGTGSDGLYYTTIRAFTRQGAIAWTVEFPGNASRYKYRLLGISEDGTRACYLESAANSIEFKTIENGVVTIGPGPLDLTSLTHSPYNPSITIGEEALVTVALNSWQTSADARRAMFVIAYSLITNNFITVFCGVDTSPGYITMPLVDVLYATGHPVFGADRGLDVCYASPAHSSSVLTTPSDIKLFRVLVTGAEAPFSASQDEVVIESYSAGLPGFMVFGSLAVSPSGKLAVGYARMWGYPWSASEWHSEAVSAKVTLVVDGVEVYSADSLSPEELGPSGVGIGSELAPITVSDDGVCVFTELVMTLSGSARTYHWLRESDFVFPALVYPRGTSPDGSAVFVSDGRPSSTYGGGIYVDSGVYETRNAWIGARLPLFVGADNEGATATFCDFQAGFSFGGAKRNYMAFEMQYDEASGAPLGYAAATYPAPGIPSTYTRAVDKPEPTPDIEVTMVLQMATADSRLRHAVI